MPFDLYKKFFEWKKKKKKIKLNPKHPTGKAIRDRKKRIKEEMKGLKRKKR